MRIFIYTIPMTKEQLKNILDNLYIYTKEAVEKKEVPVAACLVINDKTIYSYNHVEKNNDPFSHAEIEVIKEGLKETDSRYLKNSTLIVTLEPCLLCMGVILKTGIENLYYIMDDKDKGSLSYYHVFVDDVLKVHQIEDSRFTDLFSSFFKSLRKTNL